MSRGLGHVQRAIVAYFEAEPDSAFLLSELCERIYPRVNRVEKKHRIAVARAAKAIKTLDHMKRDTLGGELIFYDPLNVMSYAMARLKADTFSSRNYRNHDPRRFPCLRDLRWDLMHARYRAGAITEEEMETYETTFEIPARIQAELHAAVDAVAKNEMTEQQLRERLTTPGTRENKLIVEGGNWWRHTEMRRAQKRGDIETYNRLKEQGETALAAIVGSIGRMMAAQRGALERI
jgi:hypothetical protein